MPRRLRCSDAGYVYHVLNRAVGRAALFKKDGDFKAFEKVLQEAHERLPMRLLAYVAMPNHWHLVVWPKRSGELSAYLHWLTMTHTQRWHAQYHTVGTGPLYQGRFKSFPVQEDDHFLTVCRYVERNPLRANLVERAEAWRWGSLWHREQQTGVPWLHAWPVAPPASWVKYVNRPETEAELAAIRNSLARSAPFGDKAWQQHAVQVLGLQSCLRPRGRPRKQTAGQESL